MTTKLIQTHLIKGRQEFEIIDDQIQIRIKAPFKKEEIVTVMLTVLNPEPTITQTFLNFNSRVNGEALISLYLAKPNPEEFNSFVATVKQKALDEFNDFAGLKSVNSKLTGNVYDEPPEFEERDSTDVKNNMDVVNVEETEMAIKLLEKNLDHDLIEPLITALKALKKDTGNESRVIDVINAFNGMKTHQGAVLTYAPYISALLADDPFAGF